MMLIVNFSDIDSTMIDAVGGKALNLGVMISGGLPVPGGFCVTTDAYRLVVADRLDDLMGKLADTTDADGVTAAADEARHRVLATRAPRSTRNSDHGSVPGARRRQACCRTLLGYRRGSGVRELCRPARHLSQCDRFSSAARRGPAMLGIAVDRSSCELPQCERNRPPPRDARGGRPADDRRICSRCDVHGEPHHGQSQRNGHRCKPGSRRGRGLRSGESRPFRCEYGRRQHRHPPAGRQADHDHQPTGWRHRVAGLGRQGLRSLPG